ncbi:MAG TPA: glutathione S-transferase N-terminal domain-containing protein [Steroidobacteraceae bacterium]|nr:glutathione S-transferase N-terminal domain-containing protein [Steroidobacteraceae bacterium]
MTLRVLGKTQSINVRKVLWTCAELDLAFEHVEADATLLAKNPNALVPVIDDGGFVLWESNAICRYLAARQPHRTLLPEDARDRALVDQWLDWQATELNPAWRYAFYALVRHSPKHTDAAEIAMSVDKWNRAMRLLDDHFAAGGQFVCGEFFTLADVALGLSTHRWLHSPIDRPQLDAVHGYYQRLSVRPAFRAHVDPSVP